MAGLAELAADGDTLDEAVDVGADDDGTGLAGAVDGLAGTEGEQPPIANDATRQTQRIHR